MCNRNCNCCNNLIYTGTVSNTGTALQITLPDQQVNNNQKVCFVITTALPAIQSPLPAQLVIGKTTYKMINRCENFVYSDQIKSRRVYEVSLKTDSLLAKNVRCNLCPTSKMIPCIPMVTSMSLAKEVNK